MAMPDPKKTDGSAAPGSSQSGAPQGSGSSGSWGNIQAAAVSSAAPQLVPEPAPRPPYLRLVPDPPPDPPPPLEVPLGPVAEALGTAGAVAAAAGGVALAGATIYAASKGEETPIEVADDYYHTHFADIWGWIKGDYSDVARQKQQQLQRATDDAAKCMDNSSPQNFVSPCHATAQQQQPLSAQQPTPQGTAPAGTATQTAPQDVVKLKCKDGWDDCQKRQAREKVRRLNELADKAGGLKRAVPRVAPGDRDAADFWADIFRKEFKRISNGELNPGDAKSGTTGGTDDFMDPCLEQKWQQMKKAGKEDEFLRTVSPDHVQDIQLGGNPEGPLTWLDRSVNGSLGSQIGNSTTNPVRKFVLDCP